LIGFAGALGPEYAVSVITDRLAVRNTTLILGGKTTMAVAAMELAELAEKGVDA
jgi:hypothetical protein